MSEVPDVVNLFACGCVLPGDVLVLPPAVVLVDKALNSHNFGMRTNCHMVHAKSMDALMIAHEIQNGKFGCTHCHCECRNNS